MKTAKTVLAMTALTAVALTVTPARGVALTYDADTGAAGAQDGAGTGWNAANSNFWGGAADVCDESTTRPMRETR